MHKEILTKEQIEFLPLIGGFSKEFGLVGGTAIALHIGHRESLDFDLFSLEEFDNFKIRGKITETQKIERVIMDETNQFTFFVNGVRFTFLQYPFKIIFSENLNGVVKMPDIVTLGAMKAYALGRRPKWKDYVDLYFIIKNHYSVKDISKKAEEIFGKEFNEKLFRAQLCYFDDIDYSEKIIWMKKFETSDEMIKKELTDFSLL